jgi:voltage-gated potassium channel
VGGEDSMTAARRTAAPDEFAGSRKQVVRDLVLAVLALVSVAIGLHHLSMESVEYDALEIVDLLIVVVFWIDFVLEARRVGWSKYMRAHWWEMPSLIPALPSLVAVFPAAAVLRALRFVRILRVIGVLMRMRPVGAHVLRLARRAHIDAIFGVGAAVVFIGTLLAMLFESRENEAMKSFGQAAWFAFNMFTNVAYLDFQPVTLGGRILAGILQLCGIAFIGIFTASLAGAIVKDQGQGRERRDDGNHSGSS